MNLSSSFKVRCESISTRYRAKLKLKAFDALSGAHLAQHLEIPMLTAEELVNDYEVDAQLVQRLCDSQSWSAMLIGHESPLIVGHPRAMAARIESDTMHELAHYILGHEPVEWDAAGLPVRRAIDEEEAIYLGSCLQIPRRGLLWATQRKLTLLQTATHFGASEQMVQFRCNMTRVILTK